MDDSSIYLLLTNLNTKYMNNRTRRKVVGKYVLSPQALQRIRDIKVRIRLQQALNVSDYSIQDYIRRNSDSLTKAAALEVIREETGLVDEQILELSNA